MEQDRHTEGLQQRHRDAIDQMLLEAKDTIYYEDLLEGIDILIRNYSLYSTVKNGLGVLNQQLTDTQSLLAAIPGTSTYKATEIVVGLPHDFVRSD